MTMRLLYYHNRNVVKYEFIYKCAFCTCNATRRDIKYMKYSFKIVILLIVDEDKRRKM